MNTIVKNVLALVAGLFIGGVLNYGLIILGPSIIPPPEGVDMTTMEGLKEAMPSLPPKNFIFPFLAHALGTLVGALIVAKFAENNKMILALVVGGFFLYGGVTMIREIPGPMWFNILDLVGAYFPMAWLGHKLANGKNEIA